MSTVPNEIKSSPAVSAELLFQTIPGLEYFKGIDKGIIGIAAGILTAASLIPQFKKELIHDKLIRISDSKQVNINE